MAISWRAVLTGFVVAIVLGIVFAWAFPPTSASVWILALPGLIGGFVAGYMVSGVGNGAVHGGLATIIGALVLLVLVTLYGMLVAGIVPAIGGATLALLSLFVQAIPGAIAGAIGAWVNDRRSPQPAVTTNP